MFFTPDLMATLLREPGSVTHRLVLNEDKGTPVRERRGAKRRRHAQPRVDHLAAAVEESFQPRPEVLEAYRLRLERKLEGLSADERARFLERLERRDRAAPIWC